MVRHDWAMALTLQDDSSNEAVNSGQYHIWFIETSYKRKLGARQACSIESACRHNRDFIVHLLSTGNITSPRSRYHRLLSKRPNFRSSALNATAEVAHTPFAPLVATGGALHRSPYAMSHLSDFLRYVTLWKRGGVYLDTDVIVMKSLRGIRNSAFYQSREAGASVGSAVLFFDKHHPVLATLIEECARFYDPLWWNTCGPKTLSRLLPDAQSSGRLKLLNESAFFAVPWKEWEHLFDREKTGDCAGRRQQQLRCSPLEPSQQKDASGAWIWICPGRSVSCALSCSSQGRIY
ncbi:hypothetical protein HPB50_022248 [Hyalomma asiaticum]|uniref:Uncharacterized protein n=1 Tax=Hyalomma asiaticum TaxID=266040 RepID=A0ACB7SB24_HYAAI|nr:hypothetical protein HPB50_022248 [Hyalomma asiaticum]